MRHTRDSYVHRGDRERRRARQRKAGLLVALSASLTGLVAQSNAPAVAAAETAPAPLLRPAPVAGLVARAPHSSRLVVPSLSSAYAPGLVPVAQSIVARDRGLQEGGLPYAVTRAPHRALRRWHQVYRLAGEFGISTDLAGTIHDAAIAEGIEPDLAFRLVKAESEFNTRATSPVGAVGLTQVMPSTARFFMRGVTKQRLYDPGLNARIGFRYLRGLIKEYKSVRLALLVYNRGPAAVDYALEQGLDPANGYEKVVMKGYRGRGVLVHAE